MKFVQYFTDPFLIIQKNSFLYSLTILVVFYILSELVVLVSTRLILQLTRKTKTEIDDLIVKKAHKPISFCLLLIGIRLALLPLGIKETFLKPISNLIYSIMIIVVVYIVIVIFDLIIDKFVKELAEKTESKLDDQLIPVFHRISGIFISVIGLLFILPVWGIQIGPLLTSLGIAGVAVAFALQNTLGNIFGGMSLILDKNITVGDRIKVDSDVVGTVTDVGLRSTKIKTQDNELIIIPNGKLADSKITNFMLPDSNLRVSFNFSVGYDSDIPKVKELVLNALKKVDFVLSEPKPNILLLEIGDFALNFRVFFWINHFDLKIDATAVATEEIYNALRKEGIEIPYPTKTVYMK